MYVCMYYVCMYVYVMYVCIYYVWMYVYTYVCMHLCMDGCIWMYVHTSFPVSHLPTYMQDCSWVEKLAACTWSCSDKMMR